MKYIALALLGVSTLCAEIVPIEKLTPETAANFFSGKEPSLILECKEGVVLPVKFALIGEFLELEAQQIPLNLIVQKQCFIRLDGALFLFSSDLTSWKEACNFFTGAFGISLSTTQEITLRMDLNERKEID